jgi:hypothetical protein
MNNRHATLGMISALGFALMQQAYAEPVKHPGPARAAKPAPKVEDNAREDSAPRLKPPAADSYTCSGGTCESQARAGNAQAPSKSSYTCSGGTCE